MLQGTEKIVGRPQYIEQLKKWQSQTDLIKIVTGVRRCGKSKLFSLYQFDLVVHKIADDSQIIGRFRPTSSIFFLISLAILRLRSRGLRMLIFSIGIFSKI